jgi:hypothetical protein
MISLRLSEEEYELIKTRDHIYGSRNISELARLALQRVMTGPLAGEFRHGDGDDRNLEVFLEARDDPSFELLQNESFWALDGADDVDQPGAEDRDDIVGVDEGVLLGKARDMVATIYGTATSP